MPTVVNLFLFCDVFSEVGLENCWTGYVVLSKERECAVLLGKIMILISRISYRYIPSRSLLHEEKSQHFEE